MSKSNQDELYELASAEHGAAIGRLCCAYEADPAKRAELRQEIHMALWRSLAQFNGDCSLRTWVYRVGHNTAVTHVLKNRRHRAAEMVSLTRQRNLLRRVVTRHIPAQFPGVGLMILGTRIQYPEMPLILFVGQMVFGIAVFGLVAFLNLRGARRLQRELDVLEAN